MKSTLISAILIAASTILFTACTKEKDAPTIQPVVSQTVKNLPADPTTPSSNTAQPPGSTGKFTLYNLRDNRTVANTDSASNKWDVGFRGTTIIVNGGAIRSGQGAASVYTGTFEELTTVPASTTFAQDQSAASLAVPSGSGKGWYNYNGQTNIISPIPGRVIVLKTGEGTYAKLEILSYYKDAPATPGASSQGRYYTFRYVYQPDGSTKFN